MAESESQLQVALYAYGEVMIFSSGKVRKHCHFKFGNSTISVFL